MVPEEGFDLGDEGVGDVYVAEPFADDAAVLGLDERAVVRLAGPGLREGVDVKVVEKVGEAWAVKGKAEMRSSRMGTVNCGEMRRTAPKRWNCVTSSTALMM